VGQDLVVVLRELSSPDIISPAPQRFSMQRTHRTRAPMPYVNIQITRGATRTQKAHIVRDVTDSLVRELGKQPDHIHVVIQEIDEENWGFAGQLTDEWKKQQSDAPRPEA
jgi:4-oxalocrotonate tautomerase